jgi:hypothetical protein
MRTAKDIVRGTLGSNSMGNFASTAACAAFFVREIPEGAGNTKPTVDRLHHLFSQVEHGPCQTCGRKEDDGVGIGGYTGRWRSTPSGATVCVYCYATLNGLAELSLKDLRVVAREAAKSSH